MLVRIMAIASVAALAGCSDSMTGGDPRLDGSPEGAETAARVVVEVESPALAVLRITNLSDPAGGALLDRLALNLATSVPSGCLRIEADDGSWKRSEAVEPLCGASGSFAFGAASGGGLLAGATLDLRVIVEAGCASPVALTPALFTGAPVSAAGEALGQWGASFSAGLGPSCDAGDFDVKPDSAGGKAPPEGALLTWSEFIATAADGNGLASQDRASDSRAGSVELNFGGWLGGSPPLDDAPFAAAIVTMRNGRSDLLAQWQVNRAKRPVGLATGGCLDKPYPECWIEAPHAVHDDAIVAAVPMEGDSNEGFDDEGLRVTIEGAAHIDYAAAPPFMDNAHEHMELTWTAPLGLDTAQILLRGRLDRDADGLDEKDVMVDILRYNLPGTPDLHPDYVEQVNRTKTSLTVRVNVDDALDAVREAYGL